MFGASRAVPTYLVVITAGGNTELMWSGSQYESIPVLTAVR